MTEEKTEQPVVAVSRCESCGYEFLVSDDWEWCNACRRAAAAAELGKTSTAPKTAFDSSDWLEELGAALSHAERAYKLRVPDGDSPEHDALRCADLREIMREERPHSSNQ